MIIPATYNFEIYQGATWDPSINWVDENDDTIDLSAWTAKLTIREYYGGDIIVEITTAVDDDGNKITLAATNPNISPLITAATTAEFDFEKAVYTLELTSGSTVRHVLTGEITLVKETTE
jgi:hypothetical protein